MELNDNNVVEVLSELLSYIEADGVLGLFEHRKIVWNKFRKWNVLEDELLNFGHATHDDAVDSMVLTIGGLIRRGSLQFDYSEDPANI